jgi:hypothetical protein
MFIRVQCYAGYRGEETPHCFFIGERRIDLLDVIDRWMSPEDRYFKLRAVDNGIYILRHMVRSDSWELTLFDSGRCEQTRLSST